MRIIGFGELYLDYYLRNDKLVGVMGGKTNANILANLAKYYETAFIGIVGNDKQGDICIDSLKKLGVDTKDIKRREYPTKKFFISEDGYETICPYCNREVNKERIIIKKEDILPHIKKDDILIVDNTKDSTINILKEIDNIAFLDLGYIGNLRFISLAEITEMLSDRFKIISMNERVYKYLKNKFAIDSTDLYKLLKCEILIITKGKKGADIIYQDEFEHKEIEEPSIEIDSNGAGDSFFSEFIHTYLNSDTIDIKMISKAYLKASSISSYVVTLLGARSHLIPLINISNYKECICKEIEYDNL